MALLKKNVLVGLLIAFFGINATAFCMMVLTYKEERAIQAQAKCREPSLQSFKDELETRTNWIRSYLKTGEYFETNQPCELKEMVLALLFICQKDFFFVYKRNLTFIVVLLDHILKCSICLNFFYYEINPCIPCFTAADLLRHALEVFPNLQKDPELLAPGYSGRMNPLITSSDPEVFEHQLFSAHTLFHKISDSIKLKCGQDPEFNKECTKLYSCDYDAPDYGLQVDTFTSKLTQIVVNCFQEQLQFCTWLSAAVNIGQIGFSPYYMIVSRSSLGKQGCIHILGCICTT